MTKISAILFDKDGTLFDFAGTWAGYTHNFIWELSGKDPEFSEQMARSVGFQMDSKSFDPGSIAIAGTPREFNDALAPNFPNLSPSEFRALTRGINVEIPVAEVVPLRPYLAALRASGYPLGVATNAGEIGARKHLEAVDIVDQFDFIAGYDSGHGAKPEAGMLLAFAKHIDAAPDSIAMIGDSTHDLVAARAAGMVAVAVLTGIATHDDLVDFADVVLPSIKELPDWLATQS